MKRLVTFLLTLAMVCTMGVAVFADGGVATHDASLEPIVPDVCRHTYYLVDSDSKSEPNKVTGEMVTVIIEIWKCSKCDATYIKTVGEG